MNSLGETFYVGGCNSRDGYSAVFGCVDGMLFKRVSQRGGCKISKWKYDNVTYLLG